MAKEVWKTIPQYPKYQASNFGRIRSSNYRWSSDWRIVKPRPNGKNRWCINLHQEGVQYTHFVHTLVLWAFVGECPEGMECCHRDDNGANNNLSNLRWDTHKSNVEDKIRNGRTQMGEKNSWAKTNTETVIKIKRLYENGMSMPQIAKEIPSVTVKNIWNILRGKSWKHIK